MDLESLKAKGIEPLILVDTYDFQVYCEKNHGYTSSTWHEEIWRTYMCDYFMNGESYITFGREKNPNNIFKKLLNSFLDDFPEFENQVSMIFTN